MADMIDTYRKYGNRKDSWGRGFIPNAGGIGAMGVYALARFLRSHGLSCTTDMRLHAKGDGGVDIISYGQRIQVKTSSGRYPTQLIRRIDDRKSLVPLTADLVGFCSYPGGVTVSLLGWATQSQVEEHTKLKPAKREGARHWNSEYPSNHLEPMNRLVMHLKLAKEIHGVD